MPRHPKPVVHARDHEHGGADPYRVHYQDVGDSGPGGAGLQFDTYPQDGGWLYVRTTDQDEGDGEPNDYAIELKDTSSFGGVNVEANTNSQWLLHDGVLLLETDKDAGVDTPGSSSSGIELKALSDVIRLTGKWVYLTAAGSIGGITLAHDGSVDIAGTVINMNSPVSFDAAGGGLQLGATGDSVGFVGAAPAARQPHPTTLADVISILQTFGLCS